MKYQKYRKTATQLMRPYTPGENLPPHCSISEEDLKNGSPKLGDMIAVADATEVDMWLVAEEYFDQNYELIRQ